MGTALESLVAEVRRCELCADALPLGPRPILRLSQQARVLLVGQAPGARVHASGVAWDDPSGDRLRLWLGVERETFYDSPHIGLLPMGFCYPGTKGSGDAPPRPECAPAWHARLRAHLPEVKTTLLIGAYAQKYYLGRQAKRTLTESVRSYDSYLPSFFPLPHPSWQNNRWLRKNPWFEEEILPILRDHVAALLT